MTEKVRIEPPLLRFLPTTSIKPLDLEELRLDQPSASIRIPCVAISELGGESIFPKGAPFKEDLSDLGIVEVSADHHSDAETGKLVKTSPIHGRSYNLIIGGIQRVLWQDEYGNLFSVLNTKGNNLTNPSVNENRNQPSGFLFYGVQDSYAAIRILKASRLLREKGIDTEVVVGLLEPTAFPVNGQMVSIPEYKQYLLKSVWDEDMVDGSAEKSPSPNSLPELAKTLAETRFFISIRGMQVNERLQDLERILGHEAQTKKLLKEAFDFVNNEETIKARKEKDHEPAHFDIESEDDIKEYLVDYLPKRIATNLAKIHNLGLVHWFPHIGNISIVGSFFDLDTVRGEALGIGDDPVTEQIKHRDVQFFFRGDSGGDGANKLLIALVVRGLLDMDDNELFISNFYSAYAKERGWFENPQEHISDLFTLYEGFEELSMRESLEQILTSIFGESLEKLEMPSEITPETIAYAIEEATSYQLDDEIEKNGVNMWQAIIGPLIAEGRLEELFAQKTRRTALVAMTDLYTNQQTLDFINENYFELDGIQKFFLQRMLSRLLAYRLLDLNDQEELDEVYRRAALSYSKKADIEAYENESIVPFLNGVLEKREQMPGVMIRDGKSIYFFEEMPLEQVLNGIPKDLEIELVIREVKNSEFTDIVDRVQTGPRYLFTDGRVKMARILPIIGMAHENVTYYLWIGDRQQDQEGPLKIHMQTTIPYNEISRLKKKYPNIKFRKKRRKVVDERIIGEFLGAKVILEN